MSSLHRPDVIVLNRVENRAPERPDCEALVSPYGATELGLFAIILSAAPVWRSAVVHLSKNRRSGLEPLLTPSLSRSELFIQASMTMV
jgi:hypothetical protein